MKRNLLMNGLIVGMCFLAFSIISVPQGHAQEGHHRMDAQGSGGTPMEYGPESWQGHGMMGMMGGPGYEGGGYMSPMMRRGMMGPGMMGPGMMGSGMMGMMMSHMMAGPGGMMGMMGGMGFGAPWMLRTLELSPEQYDQIRNLARKHTDKMADLRAQQMKLRIELASLRLDQQVDREKIKNIFAKKAEAQAEMFLTGLDYLDGVKDVLDKKQLQKLEQMGF